MNKIDLNDLYLFARAVEAGGFSAAARQLNISKATISRRIGILEERLGVKLIQRNTHQFQPTATGELYYRHCADMSHEADLAERMVEQLKGKPQGTVRLSCPVEILELYVNDMLVAFMQQYPHISLDVLAVNRHVDIIEERRDFAIRAKSFPLPDSDMVVRPFCPSTQMLVASPKLLPKPLNDWDEVKHYATFSEQVGHSHQWEFTHPVFGNQLIKHQPKIITRNFNLIKKAVCAGEGIAVLPHVLIAQELHQGIVHSVLPQGWHSEQDIVHAAYPSRNGLLPSVGALLDFLCEGFKQLTHTQGVDLEG